MDIQTLANRTVYADLPSLIGNTPVMLVEHPLVPSGKKLMVKIEAFNPNFSVKDRTALGLVQRAFADGRLKKGGTLIESTSGNLGKSLAMLGAAMGFKTIIIMDPKASTHNINWAKAFGAQVEVVDNPDEFGGYQTARIERVKQLLKENPDYYWSNQYENSDNPAFHEDVTAAEFDVCDFDILCGAVSTGGHMSGIARGLRRRGHPCYIMACDVEGSAIFGSPFKPYLLNGVGLAWRSSNMDMDAFSGCLSVTDCNAISLCRLIARDTGLLFGGSGGVSLFGALAALHNTDCQSALALIPDTGANYLDQFYDDSWLDKKNITLSNHEALHQALKNVPVFLYSDEARNTAAE